MRALHGIQPLKISRFLFLLAFLTVPLYLGAVHLWSFSIAAFLLSVSCLIFLLNLHRSDPPKKLFTGIEPWIFFYLVAFAVSSALTQIPGRALSESFKLSAILLAFYLAFGHCRNDKKQTLGLLRGIAFLGGLLSFVGLLQYLGGLPRDWWHVKGFLSSVYVNHNHFAGFLELALPLAVGLVFSEDDPAKKILFIFLCVLMGTAFLFTLSRGGYATLSICLFFMVFLLLRRRRLIPAWWLAPVVLILVAGSAVIFGTTPIGQRLQTIRQIDVGEPSWAGRLQIWRGALTLISNNPWFGTGPGTFEFTFLKHHPLGLGTRPIYTHNDYLNLIADCGLLAFVAVLGGFIALFRRGLSIIHRSDDRLNVGVSLGCLTALLALSIHGLVDFNFHIPANWMWFAVSAGLMLSLGYSRSQSSVAMEKGLRSFLVVLALLTLIGSIFLGISDLCFWRGKRELIRGDGEKAISYLNRSVALNPYNDAAYYARGLVYERRKEGALSALGDFTKAGALNRFEPYYDLHKLKNLSRLPGKAPAMTAVDYQHILEKDVNDTKLLGLLLGEMLGSNTPPGDTAMRTQALSWAAKLMQVNGGYVPENINYQMSRHNLWRDFKPFFLRSLGEGLEKRYSLAEKMLWDPKTVDVLEFKDFTRTKTPSQYEPGAMYGNDEGTKKIVARKRVFRVILRAKGSLAGHAYPFLAVKLDGRTEEAVYVDTSNYSNFYCILETTPGPHTLGIQYMNDYVGDNPRKDRNVWLDHVTLQYPESP